MEIIFYDINHYLKPLFHENESLSFSLKILGHRLIIRNIHNLQKKLVDIDTIKIPKHLMIDSLNLTIKENFPSLNVVEFDDDNDINDNNDNNKNDIDTNNNYNNDNNTTKEDKENSVIIIDDDADYHNGSNSNEIKKKIIKIPINSIISFHNNKLYINKIVYPWDLLNAMKKILTEEITETKISPLSSIAKSSIIEGPCIIEDNVIIDDFCKIKGPVYIGKGSIINSGSLIRNCIIGENTKIGFSCEISNSYLKGYSRMAHFNIIAESIIGDNVWFAGYAVTANVLLSRENVKYDLGNGKYKNLETFRFGAFIGNNCKIGASAIILPGRHIPSNTLVSQNSIFTKYINKK